jgi:hypothetical protein
MTTPDDVISAFLDNEPFDPVSLSDALATPTGRDLLLDLIALRHLAQPEDSRVAAVVGRPKRGRLRLALAAATLLITLSGGYVIGERRATHASLKPPPPTQVLNLSDAKWEDVSAGGSR